MAPLDGILLLPTSLPAPVFVEVGPLTVPVVKWVFVAETLLFEEAELLADAEAEAEEEAAASVADAPLVLAAAELELSVLAAAELSEAEGLEVPEAEAESALTDATVLLESKTK